MRDKYLPIGTVVLLKGGKKRAMITGFCSVAQEDQEKIYDYSGCVYPEGYLSSNQVCLFDHDQIDKIFFLGYEDEEEKEFKDKLNQIVKNIENENSADDYIDSDEDEEDIEELNVSSEVVENSDNSFSNNQFIETSTNDISPADSGFVNNDTPNIINNADNNANSSDDSEIKPFAGF